MSAKIEMIYIAHQHQSQRSSQIFPMGTVLYDPMGILYDRLVGLKLTAS
jgi:hypothetical protein